MSEVEGQWDIVITSLQDICNANENIAFEDKYKGQIDDISSLPEDQLQQLKHEISEHRNNIATARRLVLTATEHLYTIVSNYEQKKPSNAHEKPTAPIAKTSSSAGKVSKNNHKQKIGRSYFTSSYNPSEPIVIGSEVAYKLKNRHFEEWIQCEVVRVIGDGIKFEIRDPEPDENNNPGQTFKANYKEILLIPPLDEVQDLSNYSYGAKVLARYPETTTFYPAVVVGTKKDGTVRLKFDGEEEVNKETEVERRLVLPFPSK